jgi:hypothetical protein
MPVKKGKKAVAKVVTEKKVVKVAKKVAESKK